MKIHTRPWIYSFLSGTSGQGFYAGLKEKKCGSRVKRRKTPVLSSQWEWAAPYWVSTPWSTFIMRFIISCYITDPVLHWPRLNSDFFCINPKDTHNSHERLQIYWRRKGWEQKFMLYVHKPKLKFGTSDMSVQHITSDAGTSRPSYITWWKDVSSASLSLTKQSKYFSS